MAIFYICDKCGMRFTTTPAKQRIGDKEYDLCADCNDEFCQEILPLAQRTYDEILLSWLEAK